MMEKLLIICGPTATGKTSLGLILAKKLDGEIISADSRQVYKGMDIGTGKDLPVNLKSQISNLKWNKKPISYYKIKGIKLWGYDLIEPDEEFNVALFTEFSRVMLKDICRRNKLPITVGGTGFYLKAITEPLTTIHIPPNKSLRKKLEILSIEKLQQELKKIDERKFNKLNRSDRNNPRRLIRAFEVSFFLKRQKHKKNLIQQEKQDIPSSVLWIGLTAAQKILYQRIDKRVNQRVSKRVEKEVKALINKGYNFSLPSMSALGYQQWKEYFKGKKTREEVIARWKLDEQAYAKRQITWFKNNKKINWFSISQKEFRKQVVHLVSQWYSEL